MFVIVGREPGGTTPEVAIICATKSAADELCDLLDRTTSGTYTVVKAHTLTTEGTKR